MPPGKPLCAPLLLLAVALLPRPAAAVDTGARALGAGETGYANTTDPGAGTWNVAAASLVEQYAVVAGAGLGPDRRILARGAALDSRTSAVTLGASYYWLSDNVPPSGAALPGWWPTSEVLEDATFHQGASIGLAYPFWQRRMAVAAQARFDWRDSEQLGKDTAFNFGVSWAASPGANLSFAVGAYDLLETKYPDTERTLAVGGRWAPGQYLALELAAVAPLTNAWSWQVMEWHGGASVGLVEYLRLNGGFFADSGDNFATGGVTLVSERAEVDYGVKLQVNDLDRHFHALDVRLKF